MRRQGLIYFLERRDWPKFAPPNQSFGNPNFDVVTAQVNIPRQAQLGLKIYF
jgi:hypothetical protein